MFKNVKKNDTYIKFTKTNLTLYNIIIRIIIKNVSKYTKMFQNFQIKNFFVFILMKNVLCKVKGIVNFETNFKILKNIT